MFFLSSLVTAKWLSEVNHFERDLSVNIHPVIDFIQSEEKTNEEDDEEITNLISPDEENQTNVYTIKQDWRIVLTHPVFGDEYRKYIRNIR